MLTLNVIPSEIAIYLAILLRISIVFFLTPIFTSMALPSAVKVLLSLSMAAMVYMLPGLKVAPLPFEPEMLIWTTIAELILGLIMGLAFYLIFGAFQLAGELISFQMGFGFAQVADPQNGVQLAVLSEWLQILAMLILFSMNGHHVVIRGIVESFQTIPIGGFLLDGQTYGRVIALSGQLFVISIKIAAPVMAALLVTHAGLGLMSKFAPQLNVLPASFPLTILLGFFFLAVSISAWAGIMEFYLKRLFQFFQLVFHMQ